MDPVRFNRIVTIVGILLFIPLVAADVKYVHRAALGHIIGTRGWAVFAFAQALILSLAIVFIVGRKFLYEKRKQLLLAGIVSAFCLASVEIALRLLDRRPPLYVKHPYLNYCGSPNYRSIDGLDIHNSLGYRGPEVQTPKPPGTYRIIMMGGSSAYELSVKSWKNDSSRHLERLLREMHKYENIEIVNAGLGGWDSWEGLIDFQFRSVHLQPDLIIVYHGCNDVHSRLVRPTDYKPDNTGRRKQWAEEPVFSPVHLKIVQVLTGLEPRYNFDTNAPTYSPTLDSGYSERLGMTPVEALDRNKPIYFDRNLSYLITIARQYQVAVLLVTWAHSNQLGGYAATVHYEKGFAENNEVIREVGRRYGVPVYEHAAEMPADRQYWADGVHVNDAGAELKGRLFAEYFRRSNLIAEKIEALKKGH